jgi:type IV secretory pathway VirB10-like protein
MRTFTILLTTAVALVLSACGQPVAQEPNPQPTEVIVANPTAEPTPTTDAPATETPEASEPTAPSQEPSPVAPSPSPRSEETDSPAEEPSPSGETAGSKQAEQIAASAQQSIVALPEVGPRNLTIKSIEEQEWSDTSMGCPDPAALYLAVITPGYKIVLDDGTSEFDVRANSDGSIMVWCDNGRPVLMAAAQ